MSRWKSPSGWGMSIDQAIHHRMSRWWWRRNTQMRRRHLALALSLFAAVAAGCGSSNDPSPAKNVVVEKVEGKPADMVGPQGDKAAPVSDVKLSAEDEAKVKEGNYSVAFVWHQSDPTTKAIEVGATRRFKELGIKVVGTTAADMNAATQKDNLNTVMARKPSAIITIPVDAATAAEMYRPAVEAGTKIVFLSNVPEGFEHGKDFVGVVTTDVVTAARQSAQTMGSALKGKGKIGMLTYDAKFYITNQWDKAFEDAIKKDYPGIEIVAKAGFTDPTKADEPAAGMLARHPDLDGIYTTWQDPAVGVLSALRQSGRRDVAVTMVGVNEPTALSMLKGGPVISSGADYPIEAGKVMADEVGLGVIGKPAPAFVAVGSGVFTKDNMLETWPKAYGVPAPKAIQEAAAKQ
jgi:ribose transport system substrate-binding protein